MNDANATTSLVTTTNSTRNKCLWDLPEFVQRRLLVLCASGDEGLATLLNLRLTCRWTKNLVDEYPPELQATLFSSAIVRLNCNNLEEFTASLPQLPMVTSLSISFHCHCGTVSRTSERLYEFWKDRLLFLKTHTLKMPVEDANLSRLLSLPTLNALECHTLRWEEPYSPFNSLRMGHIPSFTRSSISSLKIKNLRTSPTERLKFYLELLAVPALQHIHLCPETPNDLFTLARLVHQRTNEASFSLTLSLNKFKFFLYLRDSTEWGLMSVFAHTVTSSLSKIVLQDVPIYLLDLVVIPEESPVASEFLRRVESLNQNRVLFMLHRFAFDQLPAIFQLDGLCFQMMAMEFPPTLQTLKIEQWDTDYMMRRIRRQGTSVLSAFPPGLRNLIVSVRDLTAEEYPLFISTLAAECPSLELLDVSDVPEVVDLNCHNSGEGEGDGNHPFQRMRHLKFLRMLMDYRRRDDPQSLAPFFEMLASLPLEILIFETNRDLKYQMIFKPMLLDVVGILSTGIISRSLLTVNIAGISDWKSEQKILESANLEQLWDIVCENRHSREVRGSLPRKRLPDLDFDSGDLRNWLHATQDRTAIRRAAVQVEGLGFT